MVAVHAKRWHDRDKSAWWFLLAASPFNGVTAVVILWIVIECAFQLGNPKDNKFGAPTGGTLVEVGSAERYQPVLVILLVSATLLSMCFPRYRIHSGAMMPTLLVGDFILVNRTAYGIPMPFAYGNLVPLDQPVRGDEMRPVTNWLAIRNDAAHGKYKEYNEDQVKLLLQGITEFVARVTI